MSLCSRCKADIGASAYDVCAVCTAVKRQETRPVLPAHGFKTWARRMKRAAVLAKKRRAG